MWGKVGYNLLIFKPGRTCSNILVKVVAQMGAQVIALSAKVPIGQMATIHATNFDKYLHTSDTPNALCFKSSDTWRKRYHTTDNSTNIKQLFQIFMRKIREIDTYVFETLLLIYFNF